MKESILAKRTSIAISSIARELERLTGDEIDLSTGIRGDARHRQLHMLERIASSLKEAEVRPNVTKLSVILEVLALNLTKTSSQRIKDHYGLS